jgi:hypothetical protein
MECIVPVLEVTVTNHPPKWEWEVSAAGEMVANGFEREKIPARFEGYNAMFHLLAARPESLIPNARQYLMKDSALTRIAASVSVARGMA